MNFQDLKEQVIQLLKDLMEKIQESSAFNELKDRYENLTPRNQKALVISLCLIVSILIISIPYSYYSVSQDNMTSFFEKRDLIRDVQRLSREAQEGAPLPVAPEMEQLRMQIENELTASQLLPEQKLGVNMADLSSSKLISAAMSAGALTIHLAKLNLRQISDLGLKFQNLSPSIKMTDLDVQASMSDPKYFDVQYKLVALKVPEPPKMASPDDDLPAGKKGNKKAAPGKKKPTQDENE
jgi:hypothetical protein